VVYVTNEVTLNAEKGGGVEICSGFPPTVKPSLCDGNNL